MEIFYHTAKEKNRMYTVQYYLSEFNLISNSIYLGAPTQRTFLKPKSLRIEAINWVAFLEKKYCCKKYYEKKNNKINLK